PPPRDTAMHPSGILSRLRGHASTLLVVVMVGRFTDSFLYGMLVPLTSALHGEEGDAEGPFVFVNADRDARQLAHYLGELPGIIAQSGLDLSQPKFRKREQWRANANWKVMIENYLECYHCPVAHPGFSAMIDVDVNAYVLRPFEWFSSPYAPARASAMISGR